LKIGKNLWNSAVELYRQDNNLSRITLEKTFNIPQASAQAILNMIHNLELFENDVELQPKFKKEISDREINLDSLSYNIKTLDDLLEFSKIDLNVWKVDKVITNTWGNDKNPCYQIKAWLKRKESKDIDVKNTCENVVESIKNYSPKSYIKRDYKQDSCMLELALVDHHYGQMSWADETGQSHYDIKIAEKVYHDAVDYILSSTNGFNFDKILYVVGHDFFNVNSQNNTTAGGTFQDEDCRWQKSFNKGVQIHTDTIEKLKQIADVDVLIMVGNHDTERTFYLGSVLQGRFYNDKNVNINNEPKERKYYQYGKNLIGLTHGYKIKHDRLFGLMPVEAKKQWSDCKYYEWHIGHQHHEEKKILNVSNEESQIRLKILPTLTATDAWHAKNGFLSVRETQSFIWHKEKGNIAQFSYRP